MSNAMRDLVVPFVVLASGEIDQAPTLDKFASAFAEYCAAYAIERDVIGGAVHRVFDDFKASNKGKGVKLNAGALRTFVMKQPEVAAQLTSPEAYNVIEEMLTRFLKDNTDVLQKKDRKTKKIVREAEAYGTRLFHTSRGRGGGIFRVSDFPVKPEDAASDEDDS